MISALIADAGSSFGSIVTLLGVILAGGISYIASLHGHRLAILSKQKSEWVQQFRGILVDLIGELYNIISQPPDQRDATNVYRLVAQLKLIIPHDPEPRWVNLLSALGEVLKSIQNTSCATPPNVAGDLSNFVEIGRSLITSETKSIEREIRYPFQWLDGKRD